MKKSLLMIGLLGFAAAVTSYGQGHIAFDNYDSTPYMPVVWAGGGSIDLADIHVDLLYTLGTASIATNNLGLSVPINPASVDSFGNHGYFEGGVATIPGYVSGPVTFQVEGWLTTGPLGGSTYATASDLVRNESVAWTEPTLATGTTPVGDFTGLPGPNGAPLMIIGMPEPSAFALSSIGAAALMLIRRRK